MNSVALMSLCLSLSVILSVASPLQAAPRYYYQDLGVLEGGDQSYAYGINHSRPGGGVGKSQSLWWCNARLLEDPRPTHAGSGLSGGGLWE